MAGENTGAIIKATYGIDISPLQTGFAKAEQAAKASATKVSAALNSVQAPRLALMDRAPRLALMDRGARNYPGMGKLEEMLRAAKDSERGFWENYVDPQTAARRLKNSARGFKPAPPGKYPKPEEEDGKQRGGSLIGFGRGITVLAGVHQLIQAFVEANEEATKLAVNISKLTAPGGASAFRSESSIKANIAGITQQLDELHEHDKRESTQGDSILGNAAGLLKRVGRHVLTGTTGEEDQQKKNALYKKASESLSDLAEKQATLNRVTTAGSERDIALMQVTIAHRERLGEISRLEPPGVQNRAARTAENERYRLETAAAEDAADQRQRQLTLAAHQAHLASQGLTADQQRLAVFKDQIEAIDDQLSKTRLLTDEKKSELQTERAGLVNQLHRAQYADRNKTWEQRSAETLDAQRFQSFVKSLTGSVPGAYVTSPDAYDQKDIMGNRTSDTTAATVTARREAAFDALSRGTHMPALGHMAAFGGTDSFNSFFHRPGDEAATPDGSGDNKGNDLAGKIDDLISAVNKPDWVK